VLDASLRWRGSARPPDRVALRGHVACSRLIGRRYAMYYGYGIGGIVLLIVLILLLTGRL
jgi:hypothetical protein